MLGIALLDMPYGYYQLLRIVICGVLIWGLIALWDYVQSVERIGLGLLAISYNPVFKISMERETHAVVNLVTIAVILYLVVRYKDEVSGA